MATLTSELVLFTTPKNKMSAPGKDFNINLSRIAAHNGQNSMLAYSEKLRNFKEARERRQYSQLGDALHVKAKHIPKLAYSKMGKPKDSPRKPFSLNELTGRNTRSLDGNDLDRSLSPSFTISGKISKSSVVEEKGIPLSFVSATENNDIVGYKIKKAKKNILMQDQGTSTDGLTKAKISDFLRTSILPPIKVDHHADDFKRQLFKFSPRQGRITCVRRPNRARRMQLKGSYLNDIPECDSNSNSSPSSMSMASSNTQTLSSVRLHSQNSLINQSTARLMHNLDRHVPRSSLSDKLGIDLVNPSEILLNFNSPRYIDHSAQVEKLDQPVRKRQGVKKAKRLIFLNDRADNVKFVE